jgi:hypothetical protein
MANGQKCSWRDGEQCQFEKYGLPISMHEDRMVCRAHAPVGAADALAPDELANFVHQNVLRNGEYDLSGLHFGKRSNGGWTLASHNADNALSLRHCTFEDARAVRIEGQAVLDHSTFRVYAELVVHGANISAHEVKFECPTTIYGSASSRIDLTRAVFSESVRFDGSAGSVGRLRLDRVTFHKAPIFTDALAHHTSFNGTRFLRSARTPDDEGSYRDLRNKLHQNRAREWEGIAYELEQTCRRRSLFQQRRWFAWLTSLMYGFSARYGHSYERAWLIFLLLQLVFGLIYSWRSGRIGCCAIDWPVITYTAAQVLKPFDALSSKSSATSWVMHVTGEASDLFWPLVTSIHAVLSLSVVALAFLAMRWRFRRE